jgi:hypothetical protein
MLRVDFSGIKEKYINTILNSRLYFGRFGRSYNHKNSHGRLKIGGGEWVL